MKSPKCLARKYYEKCHQLRELMDDTTKKQRVEEWDQLLFVKKDDTLEQQNRRNDLIPDDKQMVDDEEDSKLDFLDSLLAGSRVEDLYNEANAAGQDHQGYQSFTPNWNTKDPKPMPVDGKDPFGGVGGSTFHGPSTHEVMRL